MENKTFIWITTQFEGFHKYLDAPNEVSYLKDLHRHIFHVKVSITVTHNDREIEFIMFKQWINKVIKENKLESFMSCEMICDGLYNIISLKYPNREIRIDVSEDGENGAYKEYKS